MVLFLGDVQKKFDSACFTESKHIGLHVITETKSIP